VAQLQSLAQEVPCAVGTDPCQKKKEEERNMAFRNPGIFSVLSAVYEVFSPLTYECNGNMDNT